MEVAQVFNDFSFWSAVKPGDSVTIQVNGKEVITCLIYTDGAMGFLKQRTLENLKEEGNRQLQQKVDEGL